MFRPEVIDFHWHAILHIFKPKVWFAILGSFVLTVVAYWAGVNWDPRPCTESKFGSCTSITTNSIGKLQADLLFKENQHIYY